jgi:hypothetical protein
MLFDEVPGLWLLYNRALGADGGSVYTWWSAAIGGALSIGLFAWFYRLTWQATDEEKLQAARERAVAEPLKLRPLTLPYAESRSEEAGEA